MKTVFKVALSVTLLIQLSMQAQAQAASQAIGFYSYGKCSSKGWNSANNHVAAFGRTAIEAETNVYQNAKAVECFHAFQIVKTEPYYSVQNWVTCTAVCKGYGLFEGAQMTSRTIGQGVNRTHAEAAALINLNRAIYNRQINCANPASEIYACE